MKLKKIKKLWKENELKGNVFKSKQKKKEGDKDKVEKENLRPNSRTCLKPGTQFNDNKIKNLIRRGQ